MPPDLDLDLVEEEARAKERRREEEERRQEKETEGRRRKEEAEEQRSRRSQTVRLKRDKQREEERRSRSLPRNDARSQDTFQPEEQMEIEESEGRTRERRSKTKSRRREREAGRAEEEEERDIRAARHAMHSGSSSVVQRAAFSFLMPMDDSERLSDSESASSFSEVSLSAASIATAGWREDCDWRKVDSLWQQGNVPGPWLKPSPQRLTQVLTGSRRSGQDLAGGLSL